jgi:hypothetical protein
MMIILGLLIASAFRQAPDPAWPSNRPPAQPRVVDDAPLVAAWNAAGLDGRSYGPVAATGDGSEPPLRASSWRTLAGQGSTYDAVVALLMPTDAHMHSWSEHSATSSGGLSGDVPIATTNLESEVSEVRFARLAGASLLLVNGEPFLGDVERREYEGVPVFLRAGGNAIVVIGAHDGFDLEFWKPRTRMVIATWDVWYPRHHSGPFKGDDGAVSVCVWNAATVPAADWHFHYGHLRPAGRIPDLTDWSDGKGLAPLTMARRTPWTVHLDDFSPASWRDVAMPLATWSDGDATADRRILGLRSHHERTVPRPTRAIAWPELRRACRPVLAVAESVVLVPGTSGDSDTDAALLALARLLQQRLWYWCDVVPRIVNDADYAAERRARQSPPIGFVYPPDPRVLFFGDAASNAGIASLALDLAPISKGAVAIIPDLREAGFENGPLAGVVVVSEPAAIRIAAVVDPFTDDSLAGEAITFVATSEGIERHAGLARLR